MFHCIHKKTDSIYKDITATRLDTSNKDLECNSIERLLPKGKNKKVIGWMKDELRGKMLTSLLN